MGSLKNTVISEHDLVQGKILTVQLGISWSLCKVRRRSLKDVHGKMYVLIKRKYHLSTPIIVALLSKTSTAG